MKNWKMISPIAATALLIACSAPADPNAAKEAANKAVVEKMWAAWTSADTATMSALLADNFMTHNPDPMIKSTGKQQWLDAMVMYHASSPDMKADVKAMAVDGDWVAIASVMSGTNTGAMGEGMPATNKPWEATGMDMIRFENGKAVEHRGVFDAMTMMTQLGMMGGEEMAAEVEHVCNPGCKPPDHNYLHGEKGHVCSPECPAMKEMEGKMEEKES